MKVEFSGNVGTVYNIETLNLIDRNGASEQLHNLPQQLLELENETAKRAQTAEQREAVKRIHEAKEEARGGSESGVIEKLKAAGGWAAEIAKEIGASVIAKIIEGQLGLS